MRCDGMLRWVALCAALVVVLAPAAAWSQDEKPEGEMSGMGGEAEMSAEQKAAMEAWQESMTPGAPHQTLGKMAGDYKMTLKWWEQPGAEPQTSTGTAAREMTLGGRVLEEEVWATMMGQPFEGLARTGYDNVTDRYWTTWTDNMSTSLTVMYGAIEEDGSASFEGDISDPMTGGTSRMRIDTHMEGDKEVHEFYTVGPQGEVKSMEIVYEPVS